MTVKIPGPLEPPLRKRPSRKITARSYSGRTETYEYVVQPILYLVHHGAARARAGKTRITIFSAINPIAIGALKSPKTTTGHSYST